MTGSYDTALKGYIFDEDGNLMPILEWIKKQILESSYREVDICVKDFKKILGREFMIKDDNAIYQSLKYVLPRYGLQLRSGGYSYRGRKLIISLIE